MYASSLSSFREYLSIQATLQLIAIFPGLTLISGMSIGMEHKRDQNFS